MAQSSTCAAKSGEFGKTIQIYRGGQQNETVTLNLQQKGRLLSCRLRQTVGLGQAAVQNHEEVREIMDLEKVFEQAIANQERLVHETAYKFDDETQTEFEAKIARRIEMVCIGIGHAREYPGMNAICPGLDAVWKGFKINRRRVDQLDNVYVSRAA